jgi:hypothetical protein
MRSRVILLAITLGGGLPAFAQTTGEELAALRSHLKLSSSATLAPASAPSLPPGRPLKVQIATGLDLRVRENLVRWIEEWNRKDGKKQGALEVVADGSPADLILARYAVRDKVRTQNVTGPDLFPRGPGAAGRTAASRSRYTYEVVPVFAYVIDARKPEALAILWRYTGSVTLEETKGSGRELWDGLRELMKDRARPR